MNAMENRFEHVQTFRSALWIVAKMHRTQVNTTESRIRHQVHGVEKTLWVIIPQISKSRIIHFAFNALFSREAFIGLCYRVLNHVVALIFSNDFRIWSDDTIDINRVLKDVCTTQSLNPSKSWNKSMFCFSVFLLESDSAWAIEMKLKFVCLDQTE